MHGGEGEREGNFFLPLLDNGYEDRGEVIVVLDGVYIVVVFVPQKADDDEDNFDALECADDGVERGVVPMW